MPLDESAPQLPTHQRTQSCLRPTFFPAGPSGILPASSERTEDAMKQDLLMVVGGIIATGLTMWSFLGNPPKHAAPRVMVVQQLESQPDLKAVTERSPYMRSER
jgi:hypothetical protein